MLVIEQLKAFLAADKGQAHLNENVFVRKTDYSLDFYIKPGTRTKFLVKAHKLNPLATTNVFGGDTEWLKRHNWIKRTIYTSWYKHVETKNR